MSPRDVHSDGDAVTTCSALAQCFRLLTKDCLLHESRYSQLPTPQHSRLSRAASASPHICACAAFCRLLASRDQSTDQPDVPRLLVRAEQSITAAQQNLSESELAVPVEVMLRIDDDNTCHSGTLTVASMLRGAVTAVSAEAQSLTQERKRLDEFVDSVMNHARRGGHRVASGNSFKPRDRTPTCGSC